MVCFGVSEHAISITGVTESDSGGWQTYWNIVKRSLYNMRQNPETITWATLAMKSYELI
jgi:hypothetical protein